MRKVAIYKGISKSYLQPVKPMKVITAEKPKPELRDRFSGAF